MLDLVVSIPAFAAAAAAAATLSVLVAFLAGKGSLEAGEFARRVASMTPDALEAWVGAFGACVARLGGMQGFRQQ